VQPQAAAGNTPWQHCLHPGSKHCLRLYQPQATLTHPLHTHSTSVLDLANTAWHMLDIDFLQERTQGPSGSQMTHQ
jgi:hypothetical protein